MRISDWSSDVCSSDLPEAVAGAGAPARSRYLRVDGGGEEALGADPVAGADAREIGRASCRERVCQYVSISVVAVSLKKKTHTNSPSTHTPYPTTYLNRNKTQHNTTQ